MATVGMLPPEYLGAGEIRDRYWSPPKPLPWWQQPRHLNAMALGAIAVLIVIGIYGP
jgi:hypothetical protein